MLPFFMRLWTSLRWFIVTLFLIVVVVMFFWRIINPESYHEAVQGFLNDLWEIAKFMIALFFIYLAGRLILRGLFGGNRQQRGHH